MCGKSTHKMNSWSQDGQAPLAAIVVARALFNLNTTNVQNLSENNTRTKKNSTNAVTTGLNRLESTAEQAA